MSKTIKRHSNNDKEEKRIEQERLHKLKEKQLKSKKYFNKDTYYE